MKNLYFLFLITFFSIAAEAQTYVTIPDPKFAAFLNESYSSCMNGNQLNIDCAGIQNETMLLCVGKSISNLSGVEHFTSLTMLLCGQNAITTIPALPPSLKQADFTDNELVSLPELPSTLTGLTLANNKLTSLPQLPLGMTFLNCRNNKLVALPSLPQSLTIIYCENNLLQTLPTLPVAMKWLLTHNNTLTSLPALPNTIDSLSIHTNKLTTLPSIPTSLKYLVCYGNQLTTLPALPGGLVSILCGNNKLTSLPVLPASLKQLSCENNLLTVLPLLPIDLTSFNCHFNKLTSLPALPDGIIVLSANDNLLTGLPAIPNSLVVLFAQNNQLACLPIIPSTVSAGNLEGNPLSCTPSVLSWMPNLPLCEALNGLCESAKGISGTVYHDINGNCLQDNGEIGYMNIPVEIYDGAGKTIETIYTNSSGVYFFHALQGSYSVKLNLSNVPFKSGTCLGENSLPVVLTTQNPLGDGLNFNIECKKEIAVQSVLVSGWVFPGQIHDVNILAGDLTKWYGGTCAVGQNGVIKVTYDGPVKFEKQAEGALVPSISGKVLTYTINDFSSVDFSRDFRLLFKTDTTADANDQVCLNIHTGEDDNVFNYCYLVLNSYDPNMKEVSPIDVLPEYDDWFTYTIHFQNTGNAPAFNIRLLDTLSTKLDLSTFQIVNYSHMNKTVLKDNRLKVTFPNIMLPNSTTDLKGSNGFIQYRLKAKPNHAVGTKIENTAYIYFDYNDPIVTNTATSNYVLVMGNSENNTDKAIIFPNPVESTFTIQSDGPIQKVRVIDLNGRMIKEFKTSMNKEIIDVSGLDKGIYYVKIEGKRFQKTYKIVKM